MKSHLLALGFLCLAAGCSTGKPRPASGAVATINRSRASIVRICVAVEASSGKAELQIAGTGFIARADGLILTAAHVFAGNPGAIFLALPFDRDTADLVKDRIQVVQQDVEHDVAVCSTPAGLLGPPLIVANDLELSDGDEVVVLGFPHGSSALTSVRGSIAAQFSAPLRDGQPAVRQLRIEAPINPGNSGGPVVHVRSGLVIGVVATRMGDLSQHLKLFRDDVNTANMCSNDRCVFATLRETIGTLEKYLHVGLGHAVHFSHLRTLLAHAGGV